MNNTAYQKFQDYPISPPGTGCHGSILGKANLGIMAGLSPDEIHANIRGSIPPGNRRVSDHEITEAIKKAMLDHKGTSTLLNGKAYYSSKPKPIIKDGQAVLKKIISQSPIKGDLDLWESSPIRLYDSPAHDAALLLSLLYCPDDMLFIGDKFDDGEPGKNIRSTIDWIKFINSGGRPGAHIIINPVTGSPAPKKTGNGVTLRGDSNIKTFRYCLAEFDALSREDQIRFWTAVKLPVACLIDSGNKSIHAWINVQKLAEVRRPSTWDKVIKHKLYIQGLIPLGVDRACSNPARLARMPGVIRQETEKYQKVLWMSHKGYQS
jgi:hypothetical protein